MESSCNIRGVHLQSIQVLSSFLKATENKTLSIQDPLEMNITLIDWKMILVT